MTAWTDFVKKYAAEKGISYKAALSQASEPYKSRKPEAETKAETKPTQGTVQVKRNVAQRGLADIAAKAKDEMKEARDFVFNYTPKRNTKKYRQQFNQYLNILKEPLIKEQDRLYDELVTKEFVFRWYKDTWWKKETRQAFDWMVRNARLVDEAKNIWSIKHDYYKEREKVELPPSFKRYIELDDELHKVSEYYRSSDGF